MLLHKEAHTPTVRADPLAVHAVDTDRKSGVGRQPVGCGVVPPTVIHLVEGCACVIEHAQAIPGSHPPASSRVQRDGPHIVVGQAIRCRERLPPVIRLVEERPGVIQHAEALPRTEPLMPIRVDIDDVLFVGRQAVGDREGLPLVVHLVEGRAAIVEHAHAVLPGAEPYVPVRINRDGLHLVVRQTISGRERLPLVIRLVERGSLVIEDTGSLPSVSDPQMPCPIHGNALRVVADHAI